MALYGHEIDASISPLEADLGWIVKLDKGDFVGTDALVKQKRSGRHAQARRVRDAAAAASAATATKSMLDGAAGRLGHQRRARADARTRTSDSAICRPQQAEPGRTDSDHDPQPAGGCGDGADTVLQASEMRHVSRQFPLHEGTRVGLASKATSARSASPITPSMSWATSSTWTCRRSARTCRQGKTHRLASNRSRPSPTSTRRSRGEVIEINEALAESPGEAQRRSAWRRRGW